MRKESQAVTVDDRRSVQDMPPGSLQASTGNVEHLEERAPHDRGAVEGDEPARVEARRAGRWRKEAVELGEARVEEPRGRNGSDYGTRAAIEEVERL